MGRYYNSNMYMTLQVLSYKINLTIIPIFKSLISFFFLICILSIFCDVTKNIHALCLHIKAQKSHIYVTCCHLFLRICAWWYLMTSLIRLFLTKITNLSQRHEHLCLTNFQVGIECCVRNTKKQLTIIHFICFTRVCKKGGALQYNHYVLLCIKIWWIDTILYSLLKWGFLKQPLIMLNILNLWQYADLHIQTWISSYNIFVLSSYILMV